MDWASTLIGAGIGFAVSVGLMLIQRLLERIGKLKIYCVTVRGMKANDSIGFYDNDINGKRHIVFLVPVNMEIQNTSNTARVIRDLSLWLYRDGKPVLEMIQVQKTEHTKTENNRVVHTEVDEFGGDKNMYSFVSPPRSIQRAHCSFVIQIGADEIEKNAFNELRMCYYDERDKKHVLFFKSIEGTWNTGILHGDDDWILLKENK